MARGKDMKRDEALQSLRNSLVYVQQDFEKAHTSPISAVPDILVSGKKVTENVRDIVDRLFSDMFRAPPEVQAWFSEKLGDKTEGLI